MTPLLAARLTKHFQKTRPRRSATVTQWEQALLGFLLAVATTLFVMQGFCVAGDCMQPHLYTGERVLANKLVYHLAAPKRGDIVIFDYPKDITPGLRQAASSACRARPSPFKDGQVSINGQACSRSRTRRSPRTAT